MKDKIECNNIVFKVAESKSELEQVYKFNYDIFSEELGQHAKRESGKLIDKFDERNVYFVAKVDEKLVALLSMNLASEGPMSVESRIKTDIQIDRKKSIELRLFAISKDRRGQKMAYGLLKLVYKYVIQNNVEYIFCTGTDSSIPLYQKFGYEIIGPSVREGNLNFTPMMLDMKSFDKNLIL